MGNNICPASAASSDWESGEKKPGQKEFAGEPNGAPANVASPRWCYVFMTEGGTATMLDSFSRFDSTGFS